MLSPCLDGPGEGKWESLVVGKLSEVVSDVLHSRHVKLFRSLSSKLGESANDVELEVVEASCKYCVSVALSPYLLPCGDIFLI